MCKPRNWQPELAPMHAYLSDRPIQPTRVLQLGERSNIQDMLWVHPAIDSLHGVQESLHLGLSQPRSPLQWQRHRARHAGAASADAWVTDMHRLIVPCADHAIAGGTEGRAHSHLDARCRHSAALVGRCKQEHTSNACAAPCTGTISHLTCGTACSPFCRRFCVRCHHLCSMVAADLHRPQMSITAAWHAEHHEVRQHAHQGCWHALQGG